MGVQIGMLLWLEPLWKMNVDGEKDLEVLQKTDPIVKLLTVYKDYLWGGNRLKEIFGMDNGKEILAESWMMSAHKDGGVSDDVALRILGVVVQNWQRGFP